MLKKYLWSIFALSSFLAHAEPITLQNWYAQDHVLPDDILAHWTQEVYKVTEGRVDIKLQDVSYDYGGVQYDLLASGEADVGYGLLGISSEHSLFRSRIARFPLLQPTSEGLSVKLWEVYTEMLGGFEETEDIKLLSVMALPPLGLFSELYKIKNPEDLIDLKIRSSNVYAGRVFKDMGAQSVFIPLPKLKDQLLDGKYAASTVNSDTVNFLDMASVINFATKFEGGIFNVMLFLGMSNEYWDSLSAADQQAIMEVSGSHLAQYAGEKWDKYESMLQQKQAETYIDFFDASEELMQLLKETSLKYEEEWINTVEEQGYDGRAALEKLRER